MRYCKPSCQKYPFHWKYLKRILCTGRSVTLINLSVLILLIYYSVSILFNDISPLSKFIYENENLIPFPLYLSTYINNNKNIPISKQSYPGYGNVRNATFRSTYPSIDINEHSTFDKIFILSNPRCSSNYKKFKQMTSHLKLNTKQFKSIDATLISLSSPPIPLNRHLLNINNQISKSMLKRQIAHTHLHKTVWNYVIHNKLQRVLIIDDEFMINHDGILGLPGLLNNIDIESITRKLVWHFIFLDTKHNNDVQNSNDIWSWNNGLKATLTHVSHGSSAYILSLQGAEFLSKKITHFRTSLNTEIGLLQHEHINEFISLNICNRKNQKHKCEGIIKYTVDERMNNQSLDCTWRRAGD